MSYSVTSQHLTIIFIRQNYHYTPQIVHPSRSTPETMFLLILFVMENKATETQSPLSYLTKNIVYLLVMVFLALSVILNLYMREGLYLLGLNEIHQMQEHSSSFLDFFMNTLSLLGSPWCIIPLLLVPFIVVKQRIRVFVYLIYAMIGLSLMDVWKQMFQESRPFWYNTQISKIEWFCPTDFGHPSGHSFGIVALYQPIMSDFIGLSKRRFLIGVWAVVAVLVMISRMYLGVHSLDQIVLGGLMGLCWLVLYRYWFQEQIYNMLTNLVNQSHKKLYFFFTTGFFILSTFFMVASHELNKDHRPLNSNIVDNLNQACGRDYSAAHLQKHALITTTQIFFAFGIIYGFIILSNPERTDTMYMSGDWCFTGRQQALAYIFYFTVVVIVPAATLAAVFPIVISSAVLCFFFSVVGITWAGIAIVWLMGTIQRRQGLVIFGEEGMIEAN